MIRSGDAVATSSTLTIRPRAPGDLAFSLNTSSPPAISMSSETHRMPPGRRPLDALEELAPAHAEAAHRMGVEALDRGRDRGIALGEREERLPAQPAQDVGLGEAAPRLDLGFVARLARAGRHNPNTVVGRHHAVAAVDLG